MYQNAQDAFLQSLRTILEQGKPITVRGAEVRELCAVTVAIKKPTQRVILTPGRNNNIFATIAETMWVIAGRNDVEFLSWYLPRAIDFSDDGVIWRGGYGPRLRNWRAVDQLAEAVNLLRQDPSTRRAVIVLFDPAQDFIASKDVPCNNWLHFIVREEMLHMHIAIRSNDIMWGFSGINTFEWSVLHEMVAYWIGVPVGTMTFFTSSFHLYKRHYNRATAIINTAKEKSVYDFGLQNTPFSTNLDELADTLTEWFKIETMMRQGADATIISEAISKFPDSFLRECLFLLSLYNRHRFGAEKLEIEEALIGLPSSDLKIAAVEYFTRAWRDTSAAKVGGSSTERAYYEYYWSDRAALDAAVAANVLTFREITKTLSALHYKKTLVYKDSWKKHGEVVGIFANITRKYDRIETLMVDGVRSTSDETVIDTLADLAVYAAKYLTFLAEQYPAMFLEWISSYNPTYSHEVYSQTVEGLDAMLQIIADDYDTQTEWQDIYTSAQCFEIIREQYDALENVLINGDWKIASPEKCIVSARLSTAAIHAILVTARAEPKSLTQFSAYVATL